MDELTITFLGTGTSVGIPVIGCDCPVCTSDDPRNNRLRASIYVQTPEMSFLVDTGPDLRTQCLREGITHIDAVIYTHEHSDHIMGFDDLRRFCLGEEHTMPIYATPQCAERITAAFEFAFDKKNWYPFYIKPVLHPIDGAFQLGKTKITPLDVQHGSVRTIGFLFERHGKKLVAYIPDCKTVEAHSIEAMENVDCLIIDALRHKEHPTHLNIPGALGIREHVGARQTWLTHISDFIDHEPVEDELPDDVRIAYDGLKLTLP